MIYPDRNKVIESLAEFNVVPIYKELFADFETPVSVYHKVSNSQYSFLLESVEKGEKLGRYSFVGIKPYEIIRVKNGKVYIERENNISELEASNPFDAVENHLKKYIPYDEKDLPRFYAGAVGFIGYDCVRFLEPVYMAGKEKFFEDDIVLMVPEVVIAFDHIKHTIFIIANIFKNNNIDEKKLYERAVSLIEETEELLLKETKHLPVSAKLEDDENVSFESNFEKEDFENAVEKIKNYIYAGDCIQVVLSQRLKISTKVDAFAFYRALRIVNPSPYMYYLNFGEEKIVGASPEILVRLEDGVVTIRPIAGTRKRGKDENEDKALAEELLNDEKERAEHLMLVDLARNDIGRVCRKGSVKVTNLMYIEKYSHVMHIVSNVIGLLDDGKSSFDLLKACFPAGTVSGAPKVRAMQIIDELEKEMRGPYAGAICYFNFNGNFDSAITIRTGFIKNNILYVQAGAGIVADSVPEYEYKETLKKAKAMIKAVQIAKGLEK